MVEMLTKKPLWPTLETLQLMYKISNFDPPQYDLPQSVSSEARELLDAVLIYDQERRPTAKQLLSHIWISMAFTYKAKTKFHVNIDSIQH